MQRKVYIYVYQWKAYEKRNKMCLALFLGIYNGFQINGTFLTKNLDLASFCFLTVKKLQLQKKLDIYIKVFEISIPTNPQLFGSDYK